MGPDRPVARALHAWREAERRLAQSEPGSHDYVEACRALEAARLAYLTAVQHRYELAGELDNLWADDDGIARSAPPHHDGRHRGGYVERASPSGD